MIRLVSASFRLTASLCPPAGLLAGFAACAIPAARAAPETAVPSCYATGGGSLEVCRSADEPEGVFFVPDGCRFAYDVQILRLESQAAPGPLQVVHHGEPRRESRRRAEDACGDLRATDPGLGGSVRMGRQFEQLATAMPPTAYRFWAAQVREERPRRERRRSRRSRRDKREQARAETVAAALKEGSGPRNPMTVAGRDWAGDGYHYVFMIANEVTEAGRRHVLIQGRTHDFEGLDVKARAEGSGAPHWVPFGEREMSRRRRGRDASPALAPVTDESGKPIVGNCAAEGFDTHGLVGSISVVDRVYHYFYTDVLPSDCGAPPSKRRMGLYLRTSRDVSAENAWSAAKTVAVPLPPDTLVRVAKAKGMERWTVAYSCFRPAVAPGGPVADICLHYTSDLSIGSIATLDLFSEPVMAARSPAYLALRSGGDGGGRYGRDGFFWMTDRYGNLDTPATFTVKGGFLTWLDRLAPRQDDRPVSTLYGRPVYWSTWTVRPNAGLAPRP